MSKPSAFQEKPSPSQTDPAMSTETIVVPVIDLANFPAELEKLTAAVTGLGCFRVVNHGMPATLPAEMMAVARSLFELPLEAKQLNVIDRIHNGGYLPLIKQQRLFESFGILDAAAPADVHSFCSVMKVSPRQREIISEYVSNLHGVMMKITYKVVESLDLVGYSFQEWFSGVRLHRYDFTSQEDIGSLALHSHSDVTFLTVLQEDECVDGLEIMNTDGNFVAIDPVPGTFFVFIGDIGKAWSNGRLKNVIHRVTCKKAIPRISIILALFAPKDDLVEPETALIDSDHPRLYQTFKYGEYRMAKYSSPTIAGDILPLLKEDHMNMLKGED